jgi:hypothetical protein
MSDMVKYRAVRFKKDKIAALYFTMSDIVHANKQNGTKLHLLNIQFFYF